MKTKEEELKKEIEERNKVTQKLRDKLWEIEDEKRIKKIKKFIGNIYFKTYGRGKNKEYVFKIITGLDKKQIQFKQIYITNGKEYNLYYLTKGNKLSKWELFNKLKPAIEGIK